MKMDYYEMLGVSRDCDDKTLKMAFRKLAMQYHPDRNPGCAASERKFKEIGEAYEILKDPAKRAAYDRYGHQAFENGGGRGPGFHDFTGTRFSDLFEDIFGDFSSNWGSSGNNQARGANITHKIKITLEEAYSGKNIEVKLKGKVSCNSCKGSGSGPNSKVKKCHVCKGRGRLHMMHGFFAIERACENCNGKGETIVNPCSDCRGSGVVIDNRVLSITVPAGIEDSTRIRLAGEGEAGENGAPAGDLFIFVTVLTHDFFQRQGADLFCSVPISMVTAALGGEFAVTTLDRTKTIVKVPESLQSGKQIRLKGKGMPLLRQSNKGDLYIHVTVETPQNLTRKQKELLKEFAKESSQEQNSPQAHGFFSRMKDFFEYISGSPS